MDESILVPVHLGYAWEKGQVSDRYGDYDEYLSRLKDTVWSLDSIIFPHRDDKLPFELPNSIEIIQDWSTTADSDKGIRELTARLKERGTSKVYVCGEFLWEYTQLLNAGDIERLKKPRESEVNPLALGMLNMFQNMIENRMEDLTSIGARGCCVVHTYKELSKEFNVEIIRDLCYPTIDPQKDYMENLSEKSA